VAADVFITALAFSPDKKTLASAAGFSESDIRLWDVATGKETGRLKGHGTWVSSLLFSPDGKKVISGSADQTIRVWDLASQTCVDVLRGHRQEVWRLAWLPDGKTLVSGGKDGTVCLWDTSIPHPRQPCLTVASNILTWHFAPDGQSILILDSQGKILRRAGPEFGQNETLLDLDTNRPPRLTPRLAAEFCCWSPNSQYLALGWTNGTLTVWDLPHKILCRRWTNLGYAVAPVAFFTDGTRLIAEKWFQSVDTFHELDVTTGLEIQSWAAPPHFNGGIAVSPDARWCVATGYDGDAVLRNLADESQTNPNLDFLEGSYGCYSPDGKFVAIASHLGFASVWDTTTWRRQAILGGFLNGASSVSFSPDGKRLAVASGGKEAIKLFDTDSWQEVLTLEAPGYTDSNMEFSPDGSSIGWENMTGDLFVWRAPALSAPDW
jgi:WD40 repeat protein